MWCPVCTEWFGVIVCCGAEIRTCALYCILVLRGGMVGREGSGVEGWDGGKRR